MYKRRVGNRYKQSRPFTLSRSRIDLFRECPRCFWLDRKLGLDRPSMPGFALNSAVDALLKKEFDEYRGKQEPHPLMVKYGIRAVPYAHKDLPQWRDDIHRYRGASVVHKATGLEITGIIDDIWEGASGQLYIVDYKSTSTKKEISLEDRYKKGYKAQMELYQWIFRQLGFDIADTGYFVFANGIKDRDIFDARLEFEMSVISHTGDDSWVEGVLLDIKAVLDSGSVPEPGQSCEYCVYRGLIAHELAEAHETVEGDGKAQRKLL